MKNELFDMYSWLRGYLYIILLMCISSSSFALTVTQKEIDMGGFAFPVTCATQSDLNYCVKTSEGNAAQKACMLYMTTLSPRYSFTLSSYSGGRCTYKGKNPDDNTDWYEFVDIVTRSALCPTVNNPPPAIVIFGRTGRWFPQELGDKRCFRSCEYSGAQSAFDYKHYSFTNGVMTQFTEKSSSRLKSVQEFCTAEPEPSKDGNEITYASGCEDATFSQFCEFINWFKNDSEMPDAPAVEQTNLALDQHLKTDWVDTGLNDNTVCFEPVEFNMYLPWSQTEVKKEVNFQPMCDGIDSFGNFLRALYLLHAALIVFRR